MHAHLDGRLRGGGDGNPWQVLKWTASGAQPVELGKAWPEAAAHVGNTVCLVYGHQAEVARRMKLMQLRVAAGSEVLRSGVDELILASVCTLHTGWSVAVVGICVNYGNCTSVCIRVSKQRMFEILPT